MNYLAAELRYRREQRLVAQEMAMDTQVVASTAASSGTPNMGRVLGKDAVPPKIYTAESNVMRQTPEKAKNESNDPQLLARFNERARAQGKSSVRSGIYTDQQLRDMLAR